MWKVRSTRLSQDAARRTNLREMDGPQDFKTLQRELEDLKFNYKECLKTNIEYERRLNL